MRCVGLWQVLPLLMLVCGNVSSDAGFLWDNFSGAQKSDFQFEKLISSTPKPVQVSQDDTGFWGMLGGYPKTDKSSSNPVTRNFQTNSNPVESDYKLHSNDDYEFRPFEPSKTYPNDGFIIRTTYSTPTESLTPKEPSQIDFLSSFANKRALEKLSQFVANQNRSITATTPMPSSLQSSLKSPSSLLRKMGTLPQDVSNRRQDDDVDFEIDVESVQDVDRDFNADGDRRLAAQVTAVNVLSQVQKMQDEIQDLNKQIEEENMKVKLKDLKKKMESSEEPSSSQRKGNKASSSVTRKESSNQLGQALRFLSDKRKTEEEKLDLLQQEMAKENELAKAALAEKEKIDEEKSKLSRQILRQKKREKIKKKLKERAKLSEALILKAKAEEQEKLSLAHKTLAADSNSRVIARVEEIKSQKLQEQEKKKQVIAQKQLLSLNAVKILQRKRLQNLRKKVAPLQSSNSGGAFDKLPSLLPGNKKSPLLQLSNTEKTQLLQWLDLERNSDILMKTDKAMAEKLKLKKAGQKVMKNAAQSLLDDLGGVDTDALTDEEIDELLVGLSDSGLTGTRPGLFDLDLDLDLDGNDDDDDDIDYQDELDLADLLDEYDLDLPAKIPVVPSVVPVVKPAYIPVPAPPSLPSYQQPAYQPPAYQPPAYNAPAPTFGAPHPKPSYGAPQPALVPAYTPPQQVPSYAAVPPPPSYTPQHVPSYAAVPPPPSYTPSYAAPHPPPAYTAPEKPHYHALEKPHYHAPEKPQYHAPEKHYPPRLPNLLPKPQENSYHHHEVPHHHHEEPYHHHEEPHYHHEDPPHHYEDHSKPDHYYTHQYNSPHYKEVPNLTPPLSPPHYKPTPEIHHTVPLYFDDHSSSHHHKPPPHHHSRPQPLTQHDHDYSYEEYTEDEEYEEHFHPPAPTRPPPVQQHYHKPAPHYDQPHYEQPHYEKPRYEPPHHHEPQHPEGPQPVYADPDYYTPVQLHPPSQSGYHEEKEGAEFLHEVSSLFGASDAGALAPGELSARLRTTLLEDIQDKVRTELATGPEGQIGTRVVVGKKPPRPKPPSPHQPFPHRRGPPPRYALKKSDSDDVTVDTTKTPTKTSTTTKKPKSSTAATSRTTKTTAKSAPKTAQSKLPEQKLTFSSLISDLMKGNN